MKPIQRLSATSGIVLLLGVLMFTHQTQRLRELQKRSDLLAATARATDPSFDGSTPPESPMAASRKPCPAPNPDLPGEFITRLKEKLVSSIKPEHLTGYLGDEGQFERIAATTNLSDEERAIVRQGLEPFDLQKARLYLDLGLTPAARARELAEVRRRKDEWLIAHLGKERSDAFFLSDQRHARALAEQQATVAISRLSHSLDLSDEQKDELHTGLVDRVLHPGPAGEMPDVGTFGIIQMEPPAPDVSEEVEKILTSGQRLIYQQQRENTRRNIAQRSQMLNAITESMQPALEELLQMTP